MAAVSILASIFPVLITLVLIVFLLHIVFGLIRLIFTGRLLNPITELASLVQQISKADYTHKAKTSPYREINDLTTAFNNMMHDIDSRERSLEKMQHAMDHAGDAIVITNVEGIVEYVNTAFCINTGFTEDEVLGHILEILVNSELQSTEFYQKLWRQIKQGDTWNGELVDRKKGGNC